MKIDAPAGFDYNSNNKVTLGAPANNPGEKEHSQSPVPEVQDLRDLSQRIGEDDLKSIAEGLKKIDSQLKNTRFEFSVHDATKRIFVKIIDKNTDKVVAEIPPEKFLDLIADLWKQVGLIVDKKV